MFPKAASANYPKIKEVFSAMLKLAPEERKKFLAENCEEDLRDEVESLLSAHEEAGNFLEDVSAVSILQSSYDQTASQKLIGKLIDKYRVEREIGRGGMGIVFLAERDDFYQRVALKLIKRGMDSDAILERFKREREILAALNHPFIARLLDGGTTEDGVPFFVMEYVEGVPVDEYCQTKNLSQKEKLELFRKICTAVSFAHQKLVVHRDLKPSNILVNESGEPKLLDFGIARLLNTIDANATQTNMRVLTPAYASPEQLRGEIAGTTSDLYSLGVILKELLMQQPSEPKTVNGRWKSGKDKTKSKAQTEENSPLLTHTFPPLKNDLQNIIQMALCEDVMRRYISVEKFSDDVRCYLEGLPVSARKDSFSYRAVKFIQRNRLPASVALLLVLSLIFGLFATLWEASQARHERELADQRFENLRHLSNSLVREIHDSIENLPGSLPARQLLLKRAVEQLDTLAAESGSKRDLQDELAKAYFNLASLPDTTLVQRERIIGKYISIYQSLSESDADNTHYKEQIALGDIELADLTKVRGSIADSLRFGNEAISILEKIVENEPDIAEHRKNLRYAYSTAAATYEAAGDATNVLASGRQTLKIAEELGQMNWDEEQVERMICGSRLQIGIGLTLEGDYRTAIVEFKKALDGYEARHVMDTGNTLLRYYLWSANRHLAIGLEMSGETNAAFEHLQTALSLIEELLAESPRDIGFHRNAALTHLLFGQILIQKNQSKEAIAHIRQAIELSEYVTADDADYGESKMDLARAYGLLGKALILTGNREEGLRNLLESARIYASIYDDANAYLKRDYAETCRWIGTALEKARKEEGRLWLEKSFALWSEMREKNVLSRADAGQPEKIKKQIGQL